LVAAGFLPAAIEAAPLGVRRVDDLPFVVFTVRERRTLLRLDFDRVMGSLLRFARCHPPHHLSPARANYPARLGSKERFNGSPSHSNAPFAAHCQSNRSKIIALWAARGSFHRRLELQGRAFALQAYRQFASPLVRQVVGQVGARAGSETKLAENTGNFRLEILPR
jgi:hypothetical protein